MHTLFYAFCRFSFTPSLSFVHFYHFFYAYNVNVLGNADGSFASKHMIEFLRFFLSTPCPCPSRRSLVLSTFNHYPNDIVDHSDFFSNTCIKWWQHSISFFYLYVSKYLSVEKEKEKNIKQPSSLSMSIYSLFLFSFFSMARDSVKRSAIKDYGYEQ